MDPDEMDGAEHQFEPEPRQLATREPVPWGAILLLIWAVALIIFSVQNAGDTTVQFLSWEWRMPVALLVMVTSLVTLVLTTLGLAVSRRRRRKRQAMREGMSSGG